MILKLSYEIINKVEDGKKKKSCMFGILIFFWFFFIIKFPIQGRGRGFLYFMTFICIEIEYFSIFKEGKKTN